MFAFSSLCHPTVVCCNETLSLNSFLCRECIQCSHSPVVFCHNDLQEGVSVQSKRLDPQITLGNILLPTSDNSGNIRSGSISDGMMHLSVQVPQRLVIIDFEYASYNYRYFTIRLLNSIAFSSFRAFDFANHFCEWVYDYNESSSPYFKYLPEHFPTEEQQRDFFESYLKAGVIVG